MHRGWQERSVKLTALPSDDELRVLLSRVYAKSFGEAAGPPAVVNGDLPLRTGRPNSDELTDAFEATERLIALGHGINVSTLQVFDEYELHARRNSTYATFRRLFQRFRDRTMPAQFHAALLDGDSERAIDALKRSSRRFQVKVALKIAST